jgi:hypothetical protein
VVDLFEPVAARLADADRLAAEPGLEMADRLVSRDLRRYGTLPACRLRPLPRFRQGTLA